eukprot:m.88696 g.88696  ORF g.88696 m.88696 type:complete len:378 (+) comp13182_c0_seq1:382-1515(+)
MSNLALWMAVIACMIQEKGPQPNPYIPDVKNLETKIKLLQIRSQVKKSWETTPHFMIIFATGCSRSTWMYNLLVNIIKRTGKQRLFNHKKEMIRPLHYCPPKWDRNVSLKYEWQCEKEDPLPCTQRAMIASAAAKMFDNHCNKDGDVVPGQTTLPTIIPMVVFPEHLPRHEFFSIVKPLMKNSLGIGLYRSNPLSQTICFVRDCFTPTAGYPVDENGTKSNLCFKRRYHPEVKIRAHIQPGYGRFLVSKQFRRFTHWWESDKRVQKILGTRRMSAFSSDVMSAFVFDGMRHSKAWNTSRDAFVDALEALGSPVDLKIIEHEMWRSVAEHSKGDEDITTTKFKARKESRYEDLIANAPTLKESMKQFNPIYTEYLWPD